MTYTAAFGYVSPLTHWVRPGIKPTSSWILVRFLTSWTKMGPPTTLCSTCSWPKCLLDRTSFSLQHTGGPNTFWIRSWIIQSPGSSSSELGPSDARGPLSATAEETSSFLLALGDRRTTRSNYQLNEAKAKRRTKHHVIGPLSCFKVLRKYTSFPP